MPYTSGNASVDTSKAQQNALWARYLNYKTGFSNNANDYITAYLNCDLDSATANLILINRSFQPPLPEGMGSTYVYSATTTISFDSSYTSNPSDEFETQIAANLTGTATAMCALNPPVTAYTPSDTTVDGCQSVEQQAAFVAQLLFQELQDSLVRNFDSLYRAKCLGAQRLERFYATYKPAEYHYTLYYYDQAGNLVKTLPPDAVQPNYSATYFAAVAAARAAGTDMTNGTNIEGLATQYRYNTLNQVVAQRSPDGAQSQFWYDRLGRLAVSQNAKQADSGTYSYTLYDPLGRITEVGQKPQHTVMTQTISQDTTNLASWLADLSSGGTKVQITRTVYDTASMFVSAQMTGVNLRNRVSYTMVIDADNTGTPPYRAATFYSYDPHGNVDTLLQDYGPSGVMQAVGNRYKIMTYDYDLVSGKVNQVSYQPRMADGFYHQYSYDAENRITAVKSSRDSIQWETDATYTYYRHGPLARVELGSLKLQGIDYAYTLQGWLKSINPSWKAGFTPLGAAAQYDSDGMSSTAYFERDAYKLNLNYFDDGTYTDFKPIAPNPGYVQGNALPSGAKNNLYNGNIASMAVDIRALATTGAKDLGPMIYNYGYDQLNRISSMDAWAANDSLKPISLSPLTDYKERYTYDPSGNILSLHRNGDSAHQALDQLTYNYLYAKTGGGTGEYIPGHAPATGVDHLTNQLSSIYDTVTTSNYNGDLRRQSSFNYKYDEIGELISDDSSYISNAKWSVYGKLLSLTDSSSNTISFTYDASGNRISKVSHGITTWYVRDAQGNVMSVYTQNNSAIHGDSLSQTEIDLYGSSRLGVLNLSLNCAAPLTMPASGSWLRGAKLFELTNHLGNVLETISDKKIQHTSDSSTADYYVADVAGANDYYAFGMLMPSRSMAAGGYRYGFNGQEKTDEIAGAGNHMTAEFWEYDSRIGRRWNPDPKPSVGISEYSAFNNSPVWLSDPLGDSTPVRNQIFDDKGNEIKTPTVMNISSGIINPQQFPGLRPLGDNKVLVTPGTFNAEFDPTSAVGSTNQVFTQIPGDVPGGSLFTWGHSSPTSPPSLPAFAAPPSLQFNNLITSVQNVNGRVPFNQTLNIAFNPSGRPTPNAATFVNPAAGIAQINTFANMLTRRGITNGLSLTIGTNLAGPASGSLQYANGAGLTSARGAYIQGLFAARGITVRLNTPAWNTTPNINIRLNANTIGLIGWNVTTQAMQRQVLRGNALPGTTQPVSGSSPATNFQRIGGLRPAVGSFTGQWQ